MKPAPVTLKLLGPMEVLRGGLTLDLPQSKKTRALLAYLAVTGRQHRRERLCSLLWDIPDDPRGALRWSLSKLRGVVDEDGVPRILADRDSVGLDLSTLSIDLLELRRRGANGVETAPTEDLAAMADTFRGEFLEGLELLNCPDFQAWCVAQREEARRLKAKFLAILVRRLEDEPEQAARYARHLVRLDPFDEGARATLVRMLARSGRRAEAEQAYEIAARALGDANLALSGALDRARREIGRSTRATAAPAPAAEAATRDFPERMDDAGEDAGDGAGRAGGVGLVGRDGELTLLSSTLETVAQRRRQRAVLITGEPGLGKTRLLGEFIGRALSRNATVLSGCAFEAETGRPYGPWIDALRGVPRVALGRSIEAGLSPLLPEFAAPADDTLSRDSLYGAVAELIAARAHSAPPVVIVLDDAQWFDEASAALLHYVTRMNLHRPVMIVMAARDGELPDNSAVLQVLRSLRRESVLDDLPLSPLSPEDTGAIVRGISADANVARIVADSDGNPFFAIEMARWLPEAEGEAPRSLAEIVRDRVSRLPADAVGLLRWATALGPSFGVSLLEQVVSLDLDRTMEALEILERHSLLRAESGPRDAGGRYAFAHDLVRNIVYSELSEPRRRMMHLKIARALDAMEGTDQHRAADIAHHASLAGEAALAARACVAAGQRSLRLFANEDAFSLARLGTRYAATLDPPESIRLLIELMMIRLRARRSPDVEADMRELDRLANLAIDHDCIEHARQAFHMMSVLHWEGGDWSDAQRLSLEAERISRSAGDAPHVVAMAEAARCLVMLERDLSQAEALAREADALARKIGIESSAIPDALGLLHMHRGEMEAANVLLAQGRDLARRQGDRLNEFQALVNLAILELQRENYGAAGGYAAEMAAIGDKVREGSEAPFSRVMTALAAYAEDGDASPEALDAAMDELRQADAKFRLAVAQSTAAAIELRRGEAARAKPRAEEMLAAAELLQRPSERAMARLLLLRAAEDLGDTDGAKEHVGALSREPLKMLSSFVRCQVEDVLRDREKDLKRRTRKRG